MSKREQFQEENTEGKTNNHQMGSVEKNQERIGLKSVNTFMRRLKRIFSAGKSRWKVLVLVKHKMEQLEKNKISKK